MLSFFNTIDIAFEICSLSFANSNRREEIKNIFSNFPYFCERGIYLAKTYEKK